MAAFLKREFGAQHWTSLLLPSMTATVMGGRATEVGKAEYRKKLVAEAEDRLEMVER